VETAFDQADHVDENGSAAERIDDREERAGDKDRGLDDGSNVVTKVNHVSLSAAV
jgi:hypothetical protein